jgi:ferredoxin
MPIVKFTKENKEIDVPEGTNLRKAALAAGVNVYQGINGFGESINKLPMIGHCPGIGMCATCAVLITKGKENASPMGLWEGFRFRWPDHAALHRIGHEDDMRLSCQTRVMGDMEVQTGPEFNLFGENFFS